MNMATMAMVPAPMKRKLAHWHRKRLKRAINRRRQEIAVELDALFGSRVAYGPFAGLRLSSGKWWSRADRAAMLLGIYEQEVLSTLQDVPETYRTFVDVGAADGYYAVGVLVGGLFDEVICFETSAAGQAVIQQTASINRVSDRLTIRGHAGHDFLEEFDEGQLSRAVFLIDIEGAEFDLLDVQALNRLKRSIILIEVHPRQVEGGFDKLQALKARAETDFRVSELRMGARDLSVFPELRGYNDSDRWLVCSEGRDSLMTWLRLDPINL